MGQNKTPIPLPALADSKLSAPAIQDWPKIGVDPVALTPISYKMPAELAEHLSGIIKWGEANRVDARREKIFFWALKMPVIIATAGYGVMIKFGLEYSLAISGAIASVFALIDGLYRPGELRNFHYKAYSDLSNLANDLTAKWQIGVLKGEKDLNALAAALIEESILRKDKISVYLAQAEATIGKDQTGVNK